jgi:hypothetical protein
MNSPWSLTVRNGILGTNALGGYAVGNCSSATLINSAAFSTNNVAAVNCTSTGVATLCGVNLINAPNGRQAIYAPRVRVFPGSSPTYTRHAVNGYDSYVDYWTSNATFSYPASSDVQFGVTYANSLSTGSMRVPPASAVYYSVPIGTSRLPATAITSGNVYRITDPGDTNFTTIGSQNNLRGTLFTATGTVTGTGFVTQTGLAFLTSESVWSTPITSLTNEENKVGKLLKTVLTVQSLTAYRASMSYKLVSL